MLSHSAIWNAIDTLATRHGLTPSGLARKAGLDSTTFNPSKRMLPNGKRRWPSTESIAKVLQATGDTFETFAAYAEERSPYGMAEAPAPAFAPPAARIPAIGLAQAGSGGYFDEGGFPTGEGWEEAPFPVMAGSDAYALKISGNSMEPLYRAGDTIIVSPKAAIRRGDRVVARTRAGEILAKELVRESADEIELRSFNPAYEAVCLPRVELAWMARILWVGQ